jgi:squalene-hopene/tetraprenyl-beta-curcumene cyclase
MSDDMQSAASKPEAANALEASIHSATQGLLDYRQADGHWVFELEADCTIPAEYVLLAHYLAEQPDTALEAKIGNYLRRIQGAHGGWPLVHDGDFDMSASVKAYFALKMIGDSIDAPHMVRAREAIHARGGASKSNVFTRFMLALFGVTTWRAVPVLPVEITLLPMWSPFHLNKISYWARTTLVPLLVLAALKPRAKNPKGVGIDELFLEDPRSVGMTPKAPHQSRGWFWLFRSLDSVLRVIEPLFPKRLRARAIDAAVAFVEERLNGEDGVGAIFPPMANAVMMYDALGKGADYPPRATQRRGLAKLLVIGEEEAYCQPCVSPVWDTALTCHALLEAGSEDAVPPARQGLDWLVPKQILDVKGDWAVKSPQTRSGGWAFQYNNPHYPDLDDTAVVVMAMDRARRGLPNPAYDAAIARGREWIEGMQSKDGGWAAFDVNNLEYYLNNIPFSDHGALLDPPTEDVTARCISMLAQLGESAGTLRWLPGSPTCGGPSSPRGPGTAAGA